MILQIINPQALPSSLDRENKINSSILHRKAIMENKSPYFHCCGLYTRYPSSTYAKGNSVNGLYKSYKWYSIWFSDGYSLCEE